MTESFPSQLVFWSLGYGSLIGFSFAPILMLHAETWPMRLVILGLSVPTSAFLTSAITVGFYGYGSFMLVLGSIMTQPIFLQSMLHTFSLSVSLYCAYHLYKKSEECASVEKFKLSETNSENESETNSENESETNSENESETNSENESETNSENESETNSENESETNSENESEKVSKNSEVESEMAKKEDNELETNSEDSEVESEMAKKKDNELETNSEDSEVESEMAKKEDNEWRSKVNFEGLRNAPPLPE